MSGKENESPKEKVSAVSGAMFAFPTIFALMGTSTVILFERVWTSSLNITLPHGTSISTATSSLIPQFLSYLALMSVALITILLALVAVGLIGLACVSIGRAIWALRYNFSLSWRIIYGWSLSVLPKPEIGEPVAPKKETFSRRIERNKNAIEAANEKIKSERAATKNFVNSAQGLLTDIFAGGWTILFGGDKITLMAVTARAAILGLAVFGLLMLNSQHADRHLQQLAGERFANGYPVPKDSNSDETPDSTDGEAALATVPLECTTLRAGLHNFSVYLKIFEPFSTEITCGRVTFASGYPLQGSRLRDRDGPADTRVSAPVFHLGNYGDWVVLAPFDGPTERVFVQARQVLEYSQSRPQPDASPSALAALLTRMQTVVNRIGVGDETVRSAQLLLLAQISDKISSSPESTYTTDPNINALVSWAVDDALKNQPWTDDITRAAGAQSSAIAALEQRFQDHLTAQTEAPSEELLELFRSHLDTLNGFLNQDTPNVSVELPSNFASQVTEALLQAGEIDTPPTLQDRWLNALEAQVSQRFNKEEIEHCRQNDVRVEPIIFAEGRADVSRADVGNIIAKLTEHFKWIPDGSQDVLRVQLIGFASATGRSPLNSELAERRADNVKQALVEALFGDTPSFDGNAEGPAWLSKSGLIVLAYGGGEVLDGADDEDPRRVEIHVCRLTDPDVTGDLTADFGADFGADAITPILTNVQD